MFALTHAYIACKTLRSNDSRIILGSIVPDYVWNNRKIRNKRNIHYDPFGFFNYIQKDNRSLTPFAQGIILHSDISHGVDMYSDSVESGFAFKMGKHLVGDVMNVFSLDEQNALDFSHNIIEAGTDITIANRFPAFTRVFSKTKEKISLLKIANVLSSFSNTPLNKTEKAIDDLKIFYFREDLLSDESIIYKCLIPIVESRFHKTTEKTYLSLSILLKKAKKIILGTYDSFISNTITLIQTDPLLIPYLKR